MRRAVLLGPAALALLPSTAQAQAEDTIYERPDAPAGTTVTVQAGTLELPTTP